MVTAAYGSAVALDRIDPLDEGSLATAASRVPRGSPYVLTLLRPTPEFPLDAADYDAAVALLASRAAPARTGHLYQAIAGVAGEPAAVRQQANRPFRRDLTLAGDRLTIRIEAWLPDDTFRRAGFGQVISGRKRILTIERGASLVWLAASGETHVAYAAGLYAPRPRFRIPRARLQFAGLQREH